MKPPLNEKKVKGNKNFFKEDSLLRMMVSLLIEQNDNLQLKKIVFPPENYRTFLESDVPKKLRTIAEEQKHMRAA